MLSYPAKISSYSITVSNKDASIRLRGLKQELIGDIHFSVNQSQGERPEAFINRGGFINANYPITLLSSIVMLLNQEEVLFLEENGNFINNSK